MKIFFKVLFSIFVFIIATEIILRSTGLILLREQEHSNAKLLLNSDNQIRILCIGESTTASTYFSKFKDGAWPAQLEQKLNETVPPLPSKFVVFNEGRPGTNSSLIYNSLDELIEKYHPHIVIGMIGVNDTDSNLEQYSSSNLKNLYDFKFVKAFIWIMDYFTHKSITINFENKKSYISAIKKYTQSTSELSAQKLDDIDNEYFSKLDQSQKSEYAMFTIHELSKLNFNEVSRPNAWKLSRAAINHQIVAYIQIKLKQNLYASGLIDKLIEAGMNLNNEIYPVELQFIKNTLSKINLNELTDGEIRQIVNSNSLLGDELVNEVLQKVNLKRVTTLEQNATQVYLTKIYEKLNKQNIPFFAMMYPTGSLDFYYRIFSSVPIQKSSFMENMLANYFAKDPKLPNLYFISNENFNSSCRDNFDKCFNDFFTKDRGGHFGHTTKYGHSLIAQNAYEALMQNRKLLENR